MNKLLCFLNIHKWKYIGVSEYSYKSGTFKITTEKAKCYKCERCNKEDLPWWFEKENRDLTPYYDDFFNDWKRDI